jgi:hypothetical protein
VCVCESEKCVYVHALAVMCVCVCACVCVCVCVVAVWDEVPVSLIPHTSAHLAFRNRSCTSHVCVDRVQ